MAKGRALALFAGISGAEKEMTGWSSRVVGVPGIPVEKRAAANFIYKKKLRWQNGWLALGLKYKLVSTTNEASSRARVYTSSGYRKLGRLFTSKSFDLPTYLPTYQP